MMVTNIVENGKPIGAFGDGEMWFHHGHELLPRAAPRDAALRHEAHLVGRRDLLFEHVCGLRQHPARIA